MRRSVDPATLVVCATLPPPASSGGLAVRLAAVGRSAGVVTWAADIRTLAAVAAERRGDGRPNLAVAIDPDWLDSRSMLRRMIVEARQAVPGLEAAVLRGPRPLALHGLLADEGIRVVAVETPGTADRGSRRPAPQGWRCRNPVWGLWEARIDEPRQRGFFGGLLRPVLSAPRAGGLQVLHAGDASAARLDRWLAWASGRQAAGRLRLASLAELPRLITAGGRQPVSGSILKAA